MFDTGSHPRRGVSMNRLSGSTSSPLSVIAACPNCRLETFEASSQLDWDAGAEVAGMGFRRSLRRRPFAMSGELCEEHWLMLSEMASSSAT